jgi:hypothetical protein
MRISIDLIVAIGVVSTVLTTTAATGCNDDAPDGSGLVIDIADDQPTSPELGVTLAVHARGGDSVKLSIERGSFVAPPPGGADGMPEEPGCFHSATSAPFTVELSVRPDDDEALLFASLFAQRGCTGTQVQSRIIAVHPRPANPAPADAGLSVEGKP